MLHGSVAGVEGTSDFSSSDKLSTEVSNELGDDEHSSSEDTEDATVTGVDDEFAYWCSSVVELIRSRLRFIYCGLIDAVAEHLSIVKLSLV